MNSPLNSPAFVRLLDKRLHSVSVNVWDNLPSQRDVFYTVVTDKQAWLEFFEIGDIPDIPEFNGYLSVVGLSPGYHVRMESKEFAAQVIAERKLLDDEQYGVLDDRAGKLMKAAIRTKSKIELEPFVDAFSSAFNYQTREEGVALCSSSHTTKSGVATSTGFDNAGSTTLSKPALAATKLLMSQFQNDIGERIDIHMHQFAVIIPEALEDTLDEIIMTPKGFDTAAEDYNVAAHKGYIKIVVPLLDSYDANNWFMVDMDQMKENLIWWERIAPEDRNMVDWQTMQLLQSIYFRCGWGYKGWRWIYGHAVS